MKETVKQKKARLARAQEIADGLKRGEYVAQIDNPRPTWTPPKPLVKKDQKEIERPLNPKAP